MTSVHFNPHQHHQQQQHQHQNQFQNEDDVDVDQLLAGPLAMPATAADPAASTGGPQFTAFTSNNNQQLQHQQNEETTTLADPNRAQNVALKVQLAASERELAQCRHALDLALVKAGNWNGMKHRVTLAKPLNSAPLKQWASASHSNTNNTQQQPGANSAAQQESTRASFVISSLQSQLREKDLQLSNSNSKIEELTQVLRDSEKRAAQIAHNPSASAAPGGVESEQMLGGSEEAKSALAAHYMAQMRFLHAEVERLETALTEHRERDSSSAVTRHMQTTRELQQRDAKIATLSTQLSNLKSKLTPLQKAALSNSKEGEMSPMELLSRVGQLEQDLQAAITARNEALNEKYNLGNKVRKLEERIRDAKSSAADVQNSAVEEVMQSAQQVTRLRDALATAGRDRDNLQAALDIRRLKEASKRLSSTETQTDSKSLCDSIMQTEPTERPKVSVFCQVESVPSAIVGVVRAETGEQQQDDDENNNHLHHGGTTLFGSSARDETNRPSSSSSGNETNNNNNNTTMNNRNNYSTANSTLHHVNQQDPLSVAHALQLKCAELDNVRARLGEQELQCERANIALKQTREALAAEIEVRKNLDSEGERDKAQVRTLQQTVSQFHVLLRDRDAALQAADERAQAAVNDSVKLAGERKNWEKQLAANAHDFEQLLAQQSTASEQVSQAASENEALREEVSRLLQREAQLSHALRAKDGELAEVLSSYQMCVQENESTSQSAKSIERECSNLKSALSLREERIAELQREVGVLHQREEQLTTDVQACDYENGLLHRKVVQTESAAQNQHATIADLEQQLQSQKRVTNEFERAQAELHKQLIVKDNEVVHLRRRCEVIEHDCTMLQTQHNVEKHKLRELEEANARLTVSGLMNTISTTSPTATAQAEGRAREISKTRQSLDELAQRNGFLARQVEEKDGAVAQLQQQITEERKNVEMLRSALSEKAVQLEMCQRNMEELRNLVSEQARTLAMHASHAGASDSEN